MTKSRKKKQLIVMLSEKGGEGKTTFAKALTDFKRRGPVYEAGKPVQDAAGNPVCVKRKVLVVDCNPKVGQLADAYGLKDGTGLYDPKANLDSMFEGVMTVDIKDKTKCGALVDFIDMEPDDILLDMPGGSVNDVAAVFSTVGQFIKEFQDEGGYEVIVIMVISHLIPSAKNIQPIMSAWSAADRFVVVKNTGRAPADKFIFFDGEYSARAGHPLQTLRDRDGVVIRMPRIEDDTYALFDAEQISFSDAADKNKSPFNRQDRGRMRMFLQESDDEIAKLNLA